MCVMQGKAWLFIDPRDVILTWKSNARELDDDDDDNVQMLGNVFFS